MPPSDLDKFLAAVGDYRQTTNHEDSELKRIATELEGLAEREALQGRISQDDAGRIRAVLEAWPAHAQTCIEARQLLQAFTPQRMVTLLRIADGDIRDQSISKRDRLLPWLGFLSAFGTVLGWLVKGFTGWP
jgi:hypothetical protein